MDSPKPKKESLADRLRSENMVKGEDGKMHRKVPAIIKVKAFLAIGLPVLMLVLIGLGFVPMLEGGETLWGRVVEKFFGDGDSSPAPRRVAQTPRADKLDVAHYREQAKSDDRGTLMGVGMDIEEILRDIGNSEDPKLVDIKKQLQEVHADIQKKLSAGLPPKSDVIIPSGNAKPK